MLRDPAGEAEASQHCLSVVGIRQMLGEEASPIFLYNGEPDSCT